MRIHRSQPDDDFTILPNEALRDPRLTYTARGILVELLSHADGWETNADALWRLAQKNRGSRTGEGRGAIRAAFRELEKYGYLVRRRVQGEGGRFATALHLYDDPSMHGRRTEIRTSAIRTSVDQTSESGTSKRSTKEEEPSKEELFEEHSSALVDTRAAADAARNLDQALDQLYDMVNRLNDQALRNALLNFERKRPRIYRECRQDAIGQIENDSGPASLKAQNGGRVIDLLSYKYALKHYAPDWPGWLIRPLGVVK